MLIKNKIFQIAVLLLSLLLMNSSLQAEEFNIEAKEISVDKKNNIVTGKGSVVVTDQDGITVKADKIIYERSKEFLTAEGSVEVFDADNNLLTTDKATYDKTNEIINTFQNSKANLKGGYELVTDFIAYETINKIISSDKYSVLTDIEGNIVKLDMFQYQISKNLFSSVGNIRVIDKDKNRYFFKEFHVDTKKKEMIGSDVSVLLDKKTFGLSEENDPRFVSNDIYLTKNKSTMSKGVFTVCKNRGEDKCPPWSLKAKKISRDKTKKTIYYDHAVLKFYEVPIFYFPKFFHPDPTVKRQSGFLAPFFTDSTSIGTGFGLPYFWAISHDRDLTFTTKTYSNENILFLNEYRQAFRNGFLILDTSYTEGYQSISSTKTKGSRNHIFANLDLELSNEKDYDSSLSVEVQRTSNDTYFRIHDVNTSLVDSSDTNLTNKIAYNYSKKNMFLNISSTIYEDLRKSSDRYEFFLPNILYGNTFFTEKFGTLNFQSNAFYKNYDADKHTTLLTNEVIWSPKNWITSNGLVNSLEGMVKNRNYEAKNTKNEYKTEGTINELSGVVSFKSSLPMKKKGINFSKIVSPNFMLRYAPGHMRDLSGDDVNLNYANLYSMNKTSEIEDGLSAILGLDFKINEKDENGNAKEKMSFSIGQVFNRKQNEDIPSKSSLDQKTSDVVGEFNYNFSKIGNIAYKFSLDHNLNDLNYNEVSSNFNLGKVEFNIDYLEQRNHVGTEHSLGTGVAVNFNDHNKLSYSTKKNYKTDSTELYDISYQYQIDCLTAGLVFRREFYKDSDVEEKDTLMFKITFVPFGGAKTPSIIKP